MQFHKQLYRHNPPHSYGDCYRTLLGCLLDKSPNEVPHFYDGLTYGDDCTEANLNIRRWLWEHGYALATFVYEGCTVDQLKLAMSLNNPGLYYILSGQSATGNTHVALYLEDELIWDSAPENQGILGLDRDGQMRVELLVPKAFASGWSSATTKQKTYGSSE